MAKSEIERLQEEERRAYRDLLKARDELEHAKTLLKSAQERHTDADAALIRAQAKAELGKQA